MPTTSYSCLTFRKICSRFASFWVDSQRQSWNDVRNRWQRGAFWFLVSIICGCIGFLYVIDPRYYSYKNSHSNKACQPDGSFQIDPGSFGYWSKSGFFQITLGFGVLTFTQAKAIEIIWDIVSFTSLFRSNISRPWNSKLILTQGFGRGGQALIALASWRVFASYLTVSMERTPVTFSTYRTIFMKHQSLATAIPRVARGFSVRLSLQSRTAMFFIIITMTFVLVFPTLGSAMTGYSGNVKPFVTDKSGNYVPFTSFQYLLYVIHDGWRVNETGDFAVSNSAYSDSEYSNA